MLPFRLLSALPGWLVLMTALITPTPTPQNTETLFIPIGGGYADTYAGVVTAALERADGDAVHFVVLPTTYATSAETITDEERQQNIEDAENRRSQLEEACVELAPAGTTCVIELAPIFTRPDAEDPANLEFFGDDVNAIFILGGDQTIAMQALQGTPIETALAEAYARGVIIAGTSAGLSVQSKTMIGGYGGDDFGPENALNEGAVDLWNSDEKRGLTFGITNAVLEQHFWERARIGRLLNALAQSGVPHIGVGVDAYTAVQLRNNTILENTFGLYNVAILDADTFGAAEDANFDHDDILSIRNVLFHLLAPGDFSYNLETRQPSLTPLPRSAERTLDAVTLPAGAGPLLLGGNLANAAADNPAAQRFVELTGGSTAAIAVVVFGADDSAIGENYASWLQGVDLTQLQFVYPLSTNANRQQIWDELDWSAYTGILVIAEDASLIHVEALAGVQKAWLAGKPLLLDNAAAAAAGAFYAPLPPTPAEDDVAIEAAVQGAFKQGQVDIVPGLALVNFTIEPRTQADYRWGRLVALAYSHPDVLALGLNDGTALEVTADGTQVLGSNGVFRLDLRGATLDVGTNDSFVIANGWLDVLAPGEAVDAE